MLGFFFKHFIKFSSGLLFVWRSFLPHSRCLFFICLGYFYPLGPILVGYNESRKVSMSSRFFILLERKFSKHYLTILSVLLVYVAIPTLYNLSPFKCFLSYFTQAFSTLVYFFTEPTLCSTDPLRYSF